MALASGAEGGAVDRLDVVRAEARRAGLGKPAGELGQEPGLGGRIGPRGHAGHERAETRPGAHQPGPLELAVGLVHRIRVDGQLGDDLLRGRQLVTRLQHPHPQGLVNLLYELHVGGDARRLVELELDHQISHSTNGLVE
jgi:hypothetical protein